jgi:hypothetical protein
MHVFRSYNELIYREWLYLFAIIIHRIACSPDFSNRMRILRNLVENSSSEIRYDKMPLLLASVYKLITAFNFTDEVFSKNNNEIGFNSYQIIEELSKLNYIKTNQSAAEFIYKLENHPLLLGRLSVFNSNEIWPEPDEFNRLTANFFAFLPVELLTDESYLLTASRAMLSTGDYAQSAANNKYQFLIPKRDIWRNILAAPKNRTGFDNTQFVLLKLLNELDGISAGESMKIALEGISIKFLSECQKNSDFIWRYYFVRYPLMCSGKSGIYSWRSDTDYDIHMLDKERLSSCHRDPYIYTLLLEVAGEEKKLWEMGVDEFWFTGSEKRGVYIPKSGRLFCRNNCWELAPLPGPLSRGLEEVLKKHKIDLEGRTLKVEQYEDGGYYYDSVDRISLAKHLIEDIFNLINTE